MKYQTILFDMDGTILDTLEDLQSSVNHMREKYGYPPCSLDEVRRFVGNGARVLMRRALPELMTPEREDALLEEYKAWYMAHNCVRTHPYAGIPALLEELRGAGVTTAVVSNKPHANTVDLAARFFPGLARLRPAEGIPPACARHGLAALEELARARGRALRRRQRGRRGNGRGAAGWILVGVSWGFRGRELLRQAGAEHIADSVQQLWEFVR